jgi:adenosylhomocysteine nucleosidase
MKILIVAALEDESRGAFEKLKSEQVDLIYTGIGKLNAALALTKYFYTEGKPDLVLNLGTAGGSYVDTICQVNAFVQKDLISYDLGFKDFLKQEDLKIFCTIQSPDLPAMTCATQDKFEIGTSYKVYDMSDMEGFALAKVCHLFGVRFSSIKYVTDDGDFDKWKLSLNEETANDLFEAARSIVDKFFLQN